MKTIACLLSSTFVLASVSAQEAHTSRLTGVVTDAANQPVPNCALTVEVDGRSVAQSRSDGLGTFLFGKMPGRSVVVRASGPGAAGAVAIDLTDLPEAFVQVPLWPARTLRGRVVAPDGTAVAGAWVLASPEDSSEFGLVDAIASTGADGAYELSHVLVGPVRVRAWSPTQGLFEARVDGADDVQLPCELSGESEREVEFVLRGATAAQLAAATLHLQAQDKSNRPTRLPPPLHELRPDAEGRWLVHGWTQDDRLIAGIALPCFAVVPPADFVPRGPRKWTCTFDVQPESTIAGVLRDERGQPLAEQLLFARSFRDDRVLDVVTSGRTAADGSFALASPVAPGDKFVLSLHGGEHALVHAGGRAGNLLSCYLGRHEVEARHELVARRCGVVRLRVRDADDKPVRGAVVSMVQSGGGDRPVFQVQSGAVRRQAGTGVDGVAEFRGVDLREPGMLRLDVVAASGIARLQSSVGGGEDELLDVVLSPAPVLAGTVLDGDSKPVAGARVQLMAHDDWLTQYVAVAGRDGRFAFASLHPGKYSYVARRGAQMELVRQSVELAAPGIPDLELRVK